MPRTPEPAMIDEDEGKDRRFVTALARGLDVLRCFEQGDVGLGNLVPHLIL